MPLTLAARCKINRTNINSTIVGVQIAGGNQAYAIAVNSTTNSVFSIAVAGGVSAFHGTATGRITVGVWQHVAIVFASTTSRTVYSNGTGNPNINAFTSPGIVTGVRIGARDSPDGTFNSPAVADIAEVGIWSASLNSNEISSLVAGVTPNQIRPQSLAFYSPLIREPVDFRLGLMLTNFNGATVSDHPRTYT
jgi:hypothetical protein